MYLNVSNFTLSMKCIPEVNSFNYTWEKKSYITGFDHTSQITGVNSPYLTIFNLKPEDSGDYRCIMSNSTGRCPSDYARLIVYGSYNMFCTLCI